MTRPPPRRLRRAARARPRHRSHLARLGARCCPRSSGSFDVLALDLPGFGDSPPLPQGSSRRPSRSPTRWRHAMDDAGFGRRAHLAGNSLGGWIALELARRGRARTWWRSHPRDSHCGRESDLGRGVLASHALARAHRAGPRSRSAEPARPHALRRARRSRKPWRARPRRPDRADTPARRLPRLRRDARRAPSTARSSRPATRSTVPVLVLWGTRDVVLIPRQGRRFERLIPGCGARAT